MTFNLSIKAGLSALPALLMAMATTTLAATTSIEEAVVLSAEPVYRTYQINQPTKQCWNQPVRRSQSDTPEILGTIVGAAIGNNFGSGRGQDVATVAGAVLGHSIGKDIERQAADVVYVERCETVNNYRTEARVDGYNVSYRYQGQVYNTFTRHNPGATIKLRVSVAPVE